MAVTQFELRHRPSSDSGSYDERRLEYIVYSGSETAEDLLTFINTNHGSFPGGLEVQQPDESFASSGFPIPQTHNGLDRTGLEYDRLAVYPWDIWLVTAVFGADDGITTGTNVSEFSFEIGPEDDTISHSLETITTVPAIISGGGPDPDPPDHYRAINVQLDGSVKGVKIPQAPSRMGLSLGNVAAHWTPARREKLGLRVGQVNDTAFVLDGTTYAIGTVRYLGASGRMKSTGSSLVDLRFGLRQNETGIAYPGLHGTFNVDGWDYFWVYHQKNTTSSGAKGLKPLAGYVERLFPRSDLNDLLT